MTGILLAHLSDLHLPSKLSIARFERIMAKLAELSVEHLVVTGDITDLDLSEQVEYAQSVRDILLDYGYRDPTRVTIVPGNHDLHGITGMFTAPDADTRRNLELFFQLFGRFLRRKSRSPRFPIVKRVKHLTLYCLNSITRPPGWLTLRYRLKGGQLRSLQNAFRHSPEPDRQRVVVLHHHPYRIRLRHVRHFRFADWIEDAFLWLPLNGWKMLVRTCIEHGVRYIIHGHSHSSPMVGFSDSDLVALGQGRTGHGEFSHYRLNGDSSARIRGQLTADEVVMAEEPLRPVFMVSDWR